MEIRIPALHNGRALARVLLLTIPLSVSVGLVISANPIWLVTAAPSVIAIGRVLRARLVVVADQSGVTTTNWRASRTIPWSEVAQVTSTSWGKETLLELELRKGERVPLEATRCAGMGLSPKQHELLAELASLRKASEAAEG